MATYYRTVPMRNTVASIQRKSAMRDVILLLALLFLSSATHAQKKTPENPSAKSRGATATTQARVSLSPRFSPGQTFHYDMEFETTTATSRSGLATDPQGPSKL